MATVGQLIMGIFIAVVGVNFALECGSEGEVGVAAWMWLMAAVGAVAVLNGVYKVFHDDWD